MEKLKTGDIGRMGEEWACRYLNSLGQNILARNWRGSHTEVDIISLDTKGLHFVEVKTRVAPVMAAPEVNVGPMKQRTLVKAAQIFLRSKDRQHLADVEVFFDIVSVVLDGDRTTIQYFPQAFIPMYI